MRIIFVIFKYQIIPKAIQLDQQMTRRKKQNIAKAKDTRRFLEGNPYQHRRKETMKKVQEYGAEQRASLTPLISHRRSSFLVSLGKNTVASSIVCLFLRKKGERRESSRRSTLLSRRTSSLMLMAHFTFWLMLRHTMRIHSVLVILPHPVVHSLLRGYISLRS